MYTVEYADGYYIAMNGVGLINFEDPEDGEFANFVCSALNRAVEQNAHTDGACWWCEQAANPQNSSVTVCPFHKSAPQVA